MTNQKNNDILCPDCGKRLGRKVDKDSKAINIALWCKCCKKEVIVNF